MDNLSTDSHSNGNQSWVKKEWEPIQEFRSGNVVAYVNILRLRIPEYSYRLGTVHPDGRFKGSFVQYKVVDLPFDHHLMDVLKVAEEAHLYIKKMMEGHKEEADKMAAEDAKRREAMLAKEAEMRGKKANKKVKYLANKEARKEHNRQNRHGAGGGKKGGNK